MKGIQTQKEEGKKFLFAANWKMHMGIGEARDFVQHIQSMEDGPVRLVLCVPATVLGHLAELAREKHIDLGLQNMHWEEQGAYTGEISPPMLLEAGGSYVIIGHSERRSLFGEQDEDVNRKVHAAQKHGIVPIVCVGETLAEREAGRLKQVLEEQIQRGLAGVKAEPLVVAYEPVWAIGTGKVATVEQVSQTMEYVRQVLVERFGPMGRQVPVLYGGSVKPDNIGALAAIDAVDGFLVGGASLQANSVEQMLENLPKDTGEDSLANQIAATIFQSFAKMGMGLYARAYGIASHVHLNQEDSRALFGEGRGTFVEMCGSKGCIKLRVAPEQSRHTRVHISFSEAMQAGLQGLELTDETWLGGLGCVLRGPGGEIRLENGVTAPARHLHISKEDAELYGFYNGQKIRAIVTSTERSMAFDQVMVKVGGLSGPELHMDGDEANAAGLRDGQSVMLLP